MHCFCVCSGSALLGDVEVSRSRECDLFAVRSIYAKIFLHVFIVYCLLLGFLFVLLYSATYLCLMCVSCFGLVVSSCQVIG